jgi:hypothetical protein
VQLSVPPRVRSSGATGGIHGATIIGTMVNVGYGPRAEDRIRYRTDIAGDRYWLRRSTTMPRGRAQTVSTARDQDIGTARAETSTCNPVGSSALPTKPPDIGSACAASRVTPTRIRFAPATRPFGRGGINLSVSGQGIELGGGGAFGVGGRPYSTAPTSQVLPMLMLRRVVAGSTSICRQPPSAALL